MFSLGIVDDEYLSRKCIRKLLERSDYKLKSIVEVSNAMDAIDKFKLNTPDIILVDIKMPGIDGLSLINQLHKMNLQFKAIIISSYDDFEYTKRAIKNEVCDYILKPIQYNQLISAINSAEEKLANDIRNTQIIKEAKNVPINKQIIDYLEGKNNKTTIFKDTILAPAKAKHCNLIVLYIKTTRKPNNNYDKNFVKSIIIKTITKYFSGLLLNQNDNIFVLILKLNNKVAIQKYIKQFLITLNAKYNASIGIGEVIQNISNIKMAYSHAKKACNEYLINNYNHIYFYDKLDKDILNIKDSYIIFEKEVFNHIYTTNAKYRSIIETYFNTSNFNSYQQWESIFTYFLVSLQKVFNEIDFDINILKQFEDMKTNFSNTSDILNWLLGHISKYIEKLNEQRSKKTKSKINKAIIYIQQHYTEDLSLKFISSMFKINYTYFCDIFKQITNTTFVDYITLLRFTEAKKLLLNTNLKIYEISSKIGYNNEYYFSNTFKKQEGLSPQKYRRRYKE